MDELLSDLRETFEESGFEVADVSRNRDRVRVVVLKAGANPDDLRSLVAEVVSDAEVLGFDVTTESVEGHEGMNTVVSFRHRPS